MLQSVT